MSVENNTNNPLSKVKQSVEVLTQLSQKLMGVMDDQIMAIIAGDDEEIEENSERYTNLKGVFKKKEHEFVKNIKTLLQETTNEDPEIIGLEPLKKAFPDAAAMIDQWRTELRDRMGELKDKHQRLNVLLEFAMDRNIQLFQSIYGLGNQENTRYGAGGTKEEVSSGLAVNKKA